MSERSARLRIQVFRPLHPERRLRSGHQAGWSEPSGDVQRRPGYIRGIVRQQLEHGRGDFCSIAHAGQRDLGESPVQVLLGLASA